MAVFNTSNSMRTSDEKKTWIGAILAIAFIFGYWQFELEPYMRAQNELRVKQTQSATTAAITQATGVAPSTSTVTGTQPIDPTTGVVTGPMMVHQHPNAEQAAAASTITITSDRYIAVINSLGGRLQSFQLKGYTVKQGEDALVDLVHESPEGALPGGLYLSNNVSGNDDAFVQYHVEGTSYTGASSQLITGEQTYSLPLVGSLKDGSTVKKTFNFSAQSYLIGVAAHVDGASAHEPLWIEWSRYFSSVDSNQRLNLVGFKAFSKESKVTTFYTANAPTGVSATSDNQWISIEDKYFLASLVPSVRGPNSYTIHETPPDGGHLLSIRVGGTAGEENASMYLGPKDSTILEGAGYQLYRNIDLGFWSFLAYPLLSLLKFYHSLIGNYGLSIILLTLTIKSIFLPLTMKSFKSGRAMQALQPEIKALRERITDPTVLNQEMLGLYKKRGVNPVGGCLPVLVQIPVFFGLYSLLFNAIELRHAPFALWIQDLSAPEHLMLFGVSIQLMALIWGASMFVQQLIMPAPGIDPSQRKMMLAMPLVFTGSILFYPLPAGLLLYYIINNSITITQQLSIRSERAMSPYKATLIAGSVLLAVGFGLSMIR